VDKLKEVGAGFKSLTEAIDTTTSMGEMIFHVVGAFAQFERSVIPSIPTPLKKMNSGA
jgi:DNA invertase Pin-like site-specific DNA recombinase